MVLMGFYSYFVHKLSQGYVDWYYNKFTQEAGGLIMGLSRADQGIAPYILEKELEEFDMGQPIVNFATNQSSFGKVYLNAIQKKLKGTSDNGLFILAISPGSFTAPEGMGVENILNFDKKTVMGKINNFTSAPNYDYITNCYAQPLYNVFYPNTWQYHMPHLSGWNEVKAQTESDTITKSDISHWKSLTLRKYRQKIKIERISQYRIDSFVDIIQYLKTKGKVFVIRLPADSDIIAMEDDLWGEFDKKFDSISKKHQVLYLNYSKLPNEYKTYDGSHLISKSAKKFSYKLSRDISKILKGEVYK